MAARKWTLGVAVLGAGISATLIATTVVTPVAQATAPTSAYAIIGTIALPTGADQVVVDADDDTVYAASFSSAVLLTYPPGATGGSATTVLPLPERSLSLAVDTDDDTVYVRARTGTRIFVTRAGQAVDDTISMGHGGAFNTLASLAVDSDDDTIYATMMYYQNDDTLFAVNGRNTDDSVRRQGVGGQTVSLAVDQQDDTVWIAGFDTDSLRTVAGSTLQVANVPGTYLDPRDLAVDSVNHLAYVATTVGSQSVLQKVSTTGIQATWSDPSATGFFGGLSLNPLGTRAVFKTGNNDDSLRVVDTSTMQSDGAGLTMDGINQTAQASSGLIYVASYSGTSLRVVAEIQGSLSAASAQAGDVLTITAAPTPATAAGQPVLVDDSTIASVSFGGFAAPVTHTGANTFTVTVPAGPTGTVEAVATLNGGSTMTLGNVTFGGAPAPNPVPAVPATSPGGVAAVAGDRSAAVSWTAPSSSGSFPVSHYLATSTPGAHTCLAVAPALQCEVAGLTNGTAYTFTVKALSGAGWSVSAAPSNSVVPLVSAKTTIVITGTREGARIAISGNSSALGMGGLVTPWSSRGRGDFTAGKAVLVSSDGSFTWSRRASPRASWRVYVTAGDLRSNTVTIR